MKETTRTEYFVERLPNSFCGNPRYRLIDSSGNVIGNTRPDSSLAYGPVPNYAGRSILCDIVVHITPTRRLRYVESVTPVQDEIKEAVKGL